jgi:hypothetical protein
MHFKTSLPLVALAAFGLSSAAGAVVITVEPGSNLAFFDYNIDEATRTINIFETFGPDTAGQIILKFEDWSFGASSWVINKYVTNETGSTWNSFSHELLQADLEGSVDDDGLSFAQFGVPARPRASDSFGDVFADEQDARDYLLFDGGSIVDGATGWFTFGLTAKRDTADTNVFFLRQSEFLDAVPEPATWGMLIAGFGLVGFSMRRRRMTVTSVTA